MPRFKFEWDDAISSYLDELVSEAFAGKTLPDEIDYSISQEPALDALLYEVSCEFSTPEGAVSARFTMDTQAGSFAFDVGEGSYRFISGSGTEPSFSNASMELTNANGTRTWDPDGRAWRW